MMIWNDAPVLGDSELHGPYRNGRQQKPLGAALAESSPSVQAHAVLPSRKTAGRGPLKLMDRDWVYTHIHIYIYDIYIWYIYIYMIYMYVCVW